MSAAKRFADIDAAFCRIFSKQDQIDTRVFHVLDTAHGAEDVPLTCRARIAEDVSAELESIAVRGRRL